MIFFFGSSRSWAAREARRKARLVAKKRRQSIIQATIVIFSLVVFSISIWSLRKMRLSALSVQHNSHRGNGANGLGRIFTGRILNGTKKRAVSALDAKVEMPKPPLEPELPVSKMDNSSYGTGNNKEASQEAGGVAVKSQMNFSTEGVKEVGRTSQRRSVEDRSSKESSYDDGTRRVEGEANTNPAVHGMTQEDSISRQHQTSRTYNDGYEQVGKGKEIDLLDSEEGGVGLIITMPKKKSSRTGMRRRKEDSVHESKNLMDAPDERVGVGRRYATGDRMSMDGNEGIFLRDKYSDEGNHGEQDFGKVYRRSGSVGNDYSKMHGSEMNGGADRVAINNIDVFKKTDFRDRVSSM